jgi:hypothetical protein
MRYLRKEIIRLNNYIKEFFRPKWIWLKIPKEYDSHKDRSKCILLTKKQILKKTKIIK